MFKKICIFFLSIIYSTTITSCGNRVSEEFVDDYQNFVVATDKMSAMTEIGVSYSNFLPQLYEVQSTYNALNINKWPKKLQESKMDFDNALINLKLIKEVWEFKIDESDTDYYCLVPEDLATKIIEADFIYMENARKIAGENEESQKSSISDIRDIPCMDIVGYLMNYFSFHYDNGKEIMNENL
ncbi:MAG: hypothetical protein ACYDH1_01500 [Anaerolineaceae bacterium]